MFPEASIPTKEGEAGGAVGSVKVQPTDKEVSAFKVMAALEVISVRRKRIVPVSKRELLLVSCKNLKVLVESE